ncbi:MAG: MBL fold metallo-hydrolase [Pseudomonadales bacterium]|nr:MBL fold metallo-hydrolase [Pseudomonadales bacterium]
MKASIGSLNLGQLARSVAGLVLATLLYGCSVTSHDVEPATLGKVSSWEALLAVADKPGPIVFEKHLAAHWAVDLSGLVNLDNPVAVAAGLKDKTEPIELYTYSLQHPRYGTFLVDSGISERFRRPGENHDIAWIIRQVMDTSALRIEHTTREIASNLQTPVEGVFLTHIHMDHIMGLSDLPAGVPVYVGPGDTEMKSMEYLVTQGTTDRLLGAGTHLREWQFGGGDVIDIFGDASVFAIHSPGHTPGSTAYLVRSTDGPQLITGDACHTAWGWRHGVEPGTFSYDQQRSVASLMRLIKLVRAHPGIAVHPGHQSL